MSSTAEIYALRRAEVPDSYVFLVRYVDEETVEAHRRIFSRLETPSSFRSHCWEGIPRRGYRVFADSEG